MTLVEVLASLLILSVLLSTLLVSRGRMLKLAATTDHKIAAQAAADELLSGWWAKDRSFPVSGAGTCGPKGEYCWETQSKEKAPFPMPNLQIVRLRVWGREQERQVDYVNLELLTPDPEADKDTSAQR